MDINDLKNKKIVILGFAREGFSSLKFLRRKLGNINISVADQKNINQFNSKYKQTLLNDKNIDLILGKNYLKKINKFDIIIKTSGLKLDLIATSKLTKKNIKITTNLNIFLANIKGKIIGVTGTKGKSTTATIIYKILKQAGKKTILVGNIGKPFLDFITKDSYNTFFIAELSSYQLDTLNGQLDYAIITSLFPEHINYHGSLKKYYQAKMNIANHIKPSGALIYNSNYKLIWSYIKNKKIKKIKFNSIDKKIINPKNIKIIGNHNLENIQACIEITRILKINPQIIAKTITKFTGLKNRLEYVGRFKQINFYNDVLSTTPESTIKAIESLKNKKLWTIIVGGFDRGLNYNKLIKKILSSNIKTVICWPNTGEKIFKQLNKCKNNKTIIKVKNMKQTIINCFQHTPKHHSVILSPAASSYDLYENYNQKGSEYKKLVKKFANTNNRNIR